MGAMALTANRVSGIGRLLLCPDKYFEELDARAGIRSPLMFLIICAAVCCAMSGLMEAWTQPGPYLIRFAGSMAGPLVLTLLLYLATLVLCPAGMTLGELFTIVAYSNVTLLLAWIPGFGIFAGLWSYYLTIAGIAKVGKTGGWRAFGCVVLACAALFAAARVLNLIG